MAARARELARQQAAAAEKADKAEGGKKNELVGGARPEGQAAVQAPMPAPTASAPALAVGAK